MRTRGDRGGRMGFSPPAACAVGGSGRPVLSLTILPQLGAMDNTLSERRCRRTPWIRHVTAAGLEATRPGSLSQDRRHFSEQEVLVREPRWL